MIVVNFQYLLSFINEDGDADGHDEDDTANVEQPGNGLPEQQDQSIWKQLQQLDCNGNTPLHIAAFKGYDDVVKVCTSYENFA